MDRRGFLRSGGAAAVAGGAASAAARANPIDSGAGEARHGLWPGARCLTLAVAPGYDLAGFGADRLARRIEMATDRRFQIACVARHAAAGDLSFGDAHRHVALHPGFAFFAGLPLREGLPAADLQAWLTLGGGQLLWDELARPFGLKPLVAGHSGDSLGLWSNARLEDTTDVSGLPVSATGLAARVLQTLGAAPVAIAPQDLATALTTGRIRAAEWPGPAAAFALQPLAQRLYRPGLHPGGVVITLTVDRGLWDGLTPADQAIFEACAAEEHRLALAEAKMQAVIAAQMRVGAKWPLRQTLAGPLSRALEAATCAVVADAARHDAASRRIAASYRAHRLWLSGGVTS
jgi:TRAP-type mannitol/chloroaromatic compound transport system substrate-binding protein